MGRRKKGVLERLGDKLTVNRKIGTFGMSGCFGVSAGPGQPVCVYYSFLETGTIPVGDGFGFTWWLRKLSNLQSARTVESARPVTG